MSETTGARITDAELLAGTTSEAGPGQDPVDGGLWCGDQWGCDTGEVADSAARAGVFSVFRRRRVVDLSRCRRLVPAVAGFEAKMRTYSDAELGELTSVFRRRVAGGTALDDLLPEAFAAVREASRRAMGQRHTDVQIMGGVALHLGAIADMRTGEGKTLTATLSAYLNALTGQGVHVLTGNDYLAERDAAWMGPVYRLLGVTARLIHPDWPDRAGAYRADVTYGGCQQFAYDYLRDNMALSLDECVQRGLAYAIVDEADQVMIDEARATAMIWHGGQEADPRYARYATVAAALWREVHYTLLERSREVVVTEEGDRQAAILLGEDSDATDGLVDARFLRTALLVKEFYQLDRDYLVRDGQVVGIDQLTGRVMSGCILPEGVQQAVEAKEGLSVGPDREVLASITQQSYLRLYGKLAGMTGTARAEAAEYREAYGLDVVEIPAARPVVRIDHPDRVYATEQAKDAAVVDLVAERHERGQPVLIGTRSVLESDRISALLTDRGIRATVLNARNPGSQARAIALVGRRFTVTVITGMAGRGTDIELGDGPEEYEAVCALGGLLVIGTGRHPYRRLDDHLRGRAGRRGDPGESQFLLDIESLTTLSPRVRRVVQRDLTSDDNQLMTRAVRHVFDRMQDMTERQALETRARHRPYDEVINEQRLRVYADRRSILESMDLRPRVRETIDTVIERFVADAARDTPAAFAGLDALARRCQKYYKAMVSAEQLAHVPDLTAYLKTDAQRAYQRREQELGPEVMRGLERRTVLSVIDREWRAYLVDVEFLLGEIGLRRIGKRDVLSEYRRECAALLSKRTGDIMPVAVRYMFNLDITVEDDLS